MRFVILSSTIIPGFGGMKGPVMTPQEYDLHQVLVWLSQGLDIREVMDDGSYRILQFNDSRIMRAIDQGFTANKNLGSNVNIINIQEQEEPKKEDKSFKNRKKKEKVQEEANTKEAEELAELEKEIAALEQEEKKEETLPIDDLEEI